jgi:hypothetical protein
MVKRSKAAAADAESDVEWEKNRLKQSAAADKAFAAASEKAQRAEQALLVAQKEKSTRLEEQFAAAVKEHWQRRRPTGVRCQGRVGQGSGCCSTSTWRVGSKEPARQSLPSRQWMAHACWQHGLPGNLSKPRRNSHLPRHRRGVQQQQQLLQLQQQLLRPSSSNPLPRLSPRRRLLPLQVQPRSRAPSWAHHQPSPQHHQRLATRVASQRALPRRSARVHD